MPDPAISLQSIGETTYNITDSKGLIVDLRLDIPPAGSTPPSFDVTYPTAAAGLQIKLVKGGVELNLLPTVTDDPTFPNRLVTSSTFVSMANTILTCVIESSLAVGANDEPWTVTVSSTSTNDYAFTQNDNFPIMELGVLVGDTIRRIMCDPIAAFPAFAGPVLEKATVNMTASPATGPTAGANIFQTVIGTPQPTAQYKWTYTGIISIPAFNLACGASQLFSFNAPGVYGDKTIGITLETWFDGICPATPGFLKNNSAARNLTIQPRTQYLMFVLDRSGSMSGTKWENAKTGARIMTNLFAALRSGVSASDRVGILVFEDNSCTWHTPTPDPLIAPVLSLSTPAAADGSICALNMGPAGSCTPIGDGLWKAMQLLNVGGASPRYTIILLTDGYENSGTIRVSPSTTVPVLPTPVRNFSAAQNDFPNVKNNMEIYTIGLGSSVDETVLDSLPVHTGGMYRFVTDINQTKEAIVEMVNFSQEAQFVTTSAAPGDPAGQAGQLGEHLHFELEAKVNRLAVAIEWTNPADTITLEKRDWNGAAFTGNFQPVAAPVKQCPQHGFVTVEVPTLFGGAGNENSVLATQWRVLHTSSGVPQTIQPTNLMIFVDLHVKVEIVFDKTQYRTGDQMVITALVRAGNQPVTGADITVELARPGESLGTFLATNSGRYKPTPPTGPDPNHPKAAMQQALMRSLDMQEWPVLRPPGFFIDGTVRLFDDGAHSDRARHDGNYANVYNKLDQEGTYTWRFFVQGQLADGSPFTRLLTVSKWVGIQVSEDTSSFKDEPFRGDVKRGFVGRIISVLPLDRNKQFLGPFRANEVKFKTTVGFFQGEVESHLDGWYSRVLIFPEGETPEVSVIVQGQNLAPHRPATLTEGEDEEYGGCLSRIPILGALLRWLRRCFYKK